MQISQDEIARLLRVVEHYEALTRILLDRTVTATPETYLGTLADIEAQVVRQRLELFAGNKVLAAHSLDIARATFMRYLRRPELTLVEEPIAKRA